MCWNGCSDAVGRTWPATDYPVDMASHRATAPERAPRFWTFAGIGVVVMPVFWCWYGLAQLEAETEQGKALAAGTTMAGTAFWMGGVPLILAHIVGAAMLLPLGWEIWRGRGIAFGALAVAVASAVGIGVGELVFDGQLFEVGLHRYDASLGSSGGGLDVTNR